MKNGPNPNAGRLWLNFIMTDEGQARFADGYVRPSVPGVKLPAAVAAAMPAAPQLKPLDVAQAKAQKPYIDKVWAEKVLGQ